MITLIITIKCTILVSITVEKVAIYKNGWDTIRQIMNPLKCSLDKIETIEEYLYISVTQFFLAQLLLVSLI